MTLHSAADSEGQVKRGAETVTMTLSVITGSGLDPMHKKSCAVLFTHRDKVGRSSQQGIDMAWHHTAVTLP